MMTVRNVHFCHNYSHQKRFSSRSSAAYFFHASCIKDLNNSFHHHILSKDPFLLDQSMDFAIVSILLSHVLFSKVYKKNGGKNTKMPIVNRMISDGTTTTRFVQFDFWTESSFNRPVLRRL